jgi:hypothetical protein
LEETPTSPSLRAIAENKDPLPLINADDTDLQKPLPRINANKRGSKPAVSQKGLANLPEVTKSPKLEGKTKTFTTEAAEEHRGKGKPQPRACWQQWQKR